MDDPFDRLSRALAGSLPRRHALKLIAAGAASLGAAMLGLRPASAQEKKACTCRDESDPFTGKRTVCQYADESAGYCGCNGPGTAEEACSGKKAGDACSCS